MGLRMGEASQVVLLEKHADPRAKGDAHDGGLCLQAVCVAVYTGQP